MFVEVVSRNCVTLHDVTRGSGATLRPVARARPRAHLDGLQWQAYAADPARRRLPNPRRKDTLMTQPELAHTFDERAYRDAVGGFASGVTIITTQGWPLITMETAVSSSTGSSCATGAQ